MSLGYFSTQHIISSNMLFNIRNESMKNMEIYISSFCLIWSALYIHSLETYYNISLVNSKQKCRTTKKRMRKVNDNVYYSLCCLVAAVYIRIQSTFFSFLVFFFKREISLESFFSVKFFFFDTQTPFSPLLYVTLY